MANFFENLRQNTTNLDKIKPSFNAPTNQLLLKQLWNKANWEGFDKAIDSGEVKTSKSMKDEYNTVSLMDNLYAKLSDQFQDYFYKKYYDSDAKDDVPDDVIKEESRKFIKSKLEEGELDYGFANGKTFMENFYKYKYDENLLPNMPTTVKGASRERAHQMPSGNWVTGLKKDSLFPSKISPARLTDNKQKKSKLV